MNENQVRFASVSALHKIDFPLIVWKPKSLLKENVENFCVLSEGDGAELSQMLEWDSTSDICRRSVTLVIGGDQSILPASAICANRAMMPRLLGCSTLMMTLDWHNFIYPIKFEIPY